MKRTLLVIACVLTAVTVLAQEESNDYIPFVKEGKKWNVVCSNFGEGCHFHNYTLKNEGIVKEGKTYIKMYRSEVDLTVMRRDYCARRTARYISSTLTCKRSSWCSTIL